ncbi:hypothetical protein NDU88_002452 [Pleurodeles waltl]|uniref:Uncharacterized protein n=1 Tax=Pleurodeles waltl TaxID=8319 RepID=A0AAV7M281_PLEWA|nr:hypothetical protein NDU88_002452 [Pleurodeles waltl]
MGKKQNRVMVGGDIKTIKSDDRLLSTGKGAWTNPQKMPANWTGREAGTGAESEEEGEEDANIGTREGEERERSTNAVPKELEGDEQSGDANRAGTVAQEVQQHASPGEQKVDTEEWCDADEDAPPEALLHPATP